MANDHGLATVSVATENTEIRTQRTDSATNVAGAAAPSGEDVNAGDVVAEYVRVRTSAGLFTAKPHRAILGMYAKRLIASGRWDRASLMAATAAFATTKRHPRYLEEWCSEVLTRAELAAHKERKAEERTPVTHNTPLAPLDVSAFLRRIGGAA